MISDVAVVGAGPIGLATAAELKRRGFRVVQFDKGCIGKTVEWFPKGMRFYSSPKFLELLDFPLSHSGEKPTREEYLAYLRAFTRFYDLHVHTYETVVTVSGSQGDFKLMTAKRAGGSGEYRSRYLVLAIGSNEFPRRLGIPGEHLPHVSHYFEDVHRYFGQRVVVVGARNSACDAAILLTRIGAQVTLVHRGEQINPDHLKYWVYPEITGMIKKEQVVARFQSTIQRIDEQAVEVKTPAGVERIFADFVLLLVGYEPDYRLVEQLGVEVDGPTRQPRLREETFESNVPGVYFTGTIVAGDQNPYRVFIENAQHHPKVVADAIEKAEGS